MTKQKENFVNKKLLVNAIALASVAFTLTACSGEGITSTNETTTESTSTQNTQTSGEFNHVNAPVGTVFGLVKDTNGNPVAGATVSFGDTSVTTTASGQYTLPNIAVVQSVFDDECGCSVNALALTITPPAGYLGATVTVKPKSQAITTGNNGEAPQILFLDGFSVSAGVAHLPALVATASGTLRDDDTGVPLAGVSLSLDLTSVDNNNTSATDEDHDNVGTTHTAPQFTVVTDADGKFSFTGLAADSRLNFL